MRLRHLPREIALAILFFLGSCFIPLDGQQLDTLVNTPILGITPPILADSAWRYDLQCGGAPIQPGGDLQDVQWFVADLIGRSRSHNLLGVWIPPDTIVLDITVTNNFRIVAHELLHHLRRGEPDHPTSPWIIPCHLIDGPVGG